MFPKPPQCTGCPYEHRTQGYVPGHGPPHPRLVVIGQGPGGNEVELGRPFVDIPGRAGYKLTRQLEYAGLSRDEAWVDNAMRCRLVVRGKDQCPDRAVDECYNRHWGPLLKSMEQAADQRGEPLWVLAVGGAAMRKVMGPWADASMTGSLVSVMLPSPGSPLGGTNETASA